ncbi:nitrogen fixation protein NifQ [Viridibacterium curvum]|uniref:Nitrogen fixation protein NifQ n=1 Tax=Viridibacterium curvum TaxID=1101404 RepID=A0ABP9R5U7_9RHOO
MLAGVVQGLTPSQPASCGEGVSAAALRDALLRLAPRPAYGVSIALAGVAAGSWVTRGLHCLPFFGLDAAQTRELLETHFPGCTQALSLSWQSLASPSAFDDALELEDIVTLLVDYRTVADDDSRHLAHAIATACVGEDHLWQDMHLPSRRILSELLHGFFTTLAARNRQDMKWKKFLYLQLCERAEIRVCKAPSCGVCTDYQVCFGPEA